MDKRRSNNRGERYLLKHANEWIQLTATPFAGGGEGNLYHIISPSKYQRKYVAKIYHPHKLTQERASKIDYLSTYPPSLEGVNSRNHSAVVWCKDVLLDNKKFVGFIMPYTSGEKLEILTTPKIPRKKRQTWSRFDFKEGKSALTYRLKLGFNLCTAIHQVHRMERYVLVDMKPDNIVIQPNGLVSIVDTDSVEVVEKGETLFDAPVATPEYTPPEHYKELGYDPTQQQEWDLFGLGVILYKLFFGIHPFAASTAPPHENLTTLAQKVEKGFFVHDPKHANSFSIVPPPHKAFYNLNEELQTLFMRCFVDGQEQPSLRPTAEEWCAALLLATDDKAAYERYGHILKSKIGVHKVYMSLPSNKVKVPAIRKGAQSLQILEREAVPEPTVPTLGAHEYVPTKNASKYSSKHVLIAMIFSIGLLATGLIPISVIVLAIFLGKVQEEFKKSVEYRNAKRAQVRLQKAKKKYQYIKKRTSVNQRRLKRSLGKTARHIENILNLIKQEINTLKDFLKEQDKKVQQLNEEANKHYHLINEEFLQQAKANRAVARVEVDQYKSLAQIKAALQTEQKKAVEELSRRYAQENEQEQYLQEKIAIEELFEQKKQQIGKKKGEEKSRLETAKKVALNQLYQKLQREASISSNWERLWKGIKKSGHASKTLGERFKEAGLATMLQVDRIDLNDNYIVLKNGQKIVLNGIASSKQILRNMFKWMYEIRHEQDKVEQEKQKISRGIQIGIDSLQDDERLEIKQLEQTKQQQLQKVKVVVPVEELGDSYQQLQQHYTTASSYVEELEEAYKEEEQNVTNQFEAQYEDIIAASEAKAAMTKAHVEQLEQQLQTYRKKLQHKKTQRGLRDLKVHQDKLAEASQELQEQMRRVEQYKNITFINYIKAVAKTKKK